MPSIPVGPDEAFTGAGPLRSSRGPESGTAEKPFVSVRVGNHTADAILDTGGVWLVLSPTEAELAGLADCPALTGERLNIRGHNVDGNLYRHPVELVATQGGSIEVELTLFVPSYPEDRWDLPNFLGWQGCLDRFRFALDAEAERFYFGVIGNLAP